MNNYLMIILLFAIGAGVGSFIYVLTNRTHNKQSIHGQSRCDSCNHKLSWFELMPIFGWLICCGKCRYCKASIGLGSVLVEIVTAALFAVSYIFWPGVFDGLVGVNLFVLWLIILSGLVALALYDFKYTKLPNKLIYPVIIVAALFWLVSAISSQQMLQVGHWAELLFAMLPITGVYGAVYLASGGGLIGLGDVKLGIIAGFLLTWQGTLAVLLLANMFTLIIYLCLPKKQRANRQIPFAPALVAAITLIFLCYETFHELLLSAGL